MDLFKILFIALLAFILGSFFGYGATHGEIVTECQRIGTFYVGEKVFKCELTDSEKARGGE